MISLAAFDQMPTVATLHADVTRVLEVARFFRVKRETDGSETHFWILTKPVHPYPAGTVMTLARLHDLIFGKAVT